MLELGCIFGCLLTIILLPIMIPIMLATTKPCQYCRNRINKKALVCTKCGRDQDLEPND